MKHSVNFCNRISKFLFLICLVSTSYIKPLKILVAVEVFPSSLQIFILNQITGLIDAGHDVHIFAFRDKQVGIENPIIPTDVIKYNLLSKTYYQQLPDLSVFDILYCQFGSTANKLLPLLAHYTTTPKFITCLRGGDASTAFIKDPHVYDELFKKADYLFPVCKHFAKRLIAYGCPPEKIIVHHSSIDCNAFEFTERTWPKDTILRLTTVGRLYKEKGHEHAIKAVAQLAKKYTNIHYKIIGDGPYKKELEKLIAKLKMQKTIELAGLVSHDSMPQELALTHIFILTPFTLKKSDGMTQIGMEEGIPNALMEAMACGIPVIGTRHAGIPELIQNNISGLLVEERNVEQIYDALDWFISHSDSWAQFGKKGRKHVLKHHNITHQISRLDKLFKKLTSKNLLPVTRNYEHIITSFDFWD